MIQSPTFGFERCDRLLSAPSARGTLGPQATMALGQGWMRRGLAGGAVLGAYRTYFDRVRLSPTGAGVPIR
jgi:hypothetical protein